MSGFVIVQRWVKVGVARNRPSYVGIPVVYAFWINEGDMDAALFLFLFVTKYGCLFGKRKTRRTIAVYLGILGGTTWDRSSASHSTTIAVSIRNVR